VRGGWDSAGGDEVAAAFARHDWLAATDDAALLRARLHQAETVRLRRELVAVGGEWVPVAARLRVEGGIDGAGGIDPHGERVVAGCDGATPLQALLDDLARALGAELAEILPGALAAVRRLVERGALLP
jgi:hypothetical protein